MFSLFLFFSIISMEVDEKEEAVLERALDKHSRVSEEKMSPEEILAQAQDAAATAKHMLTTRKPKTDVCHTHTHTHTHIYIYIYLHLNTC